MNVNVNVNTYDSDDCRNSTALHNLWGRLVKISRDFYAFCDSRPACATMPRKSHRDGAARDGAFRFR